MLVVYSFFVFIMQRVLEWYKHTEKNCFSLSYAVKITSVIAMLILMLTGIDWRYRLSLFTYDG